MNFKSVLNDVCCDNRIKNGVIDLKNADHVFVLQEYLENAGFDIETIVNKTAQLFEAGKFPDRQAYNKDGILVTFPNKEYRDRAINKGTHFAENPKKGETNIFTEPPADIEQKPEEPKGSVPIDTELEKKADDESEDSYEDRTPKEKVVDAQSVDYILTGETPLVNYSVDEAKRYGFYNKGLLWYDSDGNLIGEQIFDEKNNKPLVRSLIKESAEEIETAIVNALKGQGYPKKNIESVAKKVATSIKSMTGPIKNTRRVGRETAPLSEFWRSYHATDNTPKTDIIINQARSSVKYGPSQLMSGGKNETIATFMAAVDASPTLNQSVVSNIQTMLDNFVSSTKTIQGGVESLLRKDKSQIKNGLEAKVKEIVDTGDKAHKELTKYLETVFSSDSNFKYAFIREAMTGMRKFGVESYACADYILSVSKTGDSVYFNPINESVIGSVANSTRVSVRFKSASVQVDKVKTGEYRFWSVLSLIVKDYKEKYKKINEIIDQNEMLTEGVLDQIKSVLTNISQFVSKIYGQIKEYISRGFNYALDFLGLTIEDDSVIINGQPGNSKIYLDFPSVLHDNTPDGAQNIISTT